jgi:D-alanyl-D-alanine carboxypeptidase
MNQMKFIFLLIFLFSIELSHGQQANFARRIDSLLSVGQKKTFNGTILVLCKGKVLYSKTCGYSNLPDSVPLLATDQFVIGSISKQFTAALVLREYDRGRLDLFKPIRTYLPDLLQAWADTVTVHHLLTHLHGIVGLDKPTAFTVGSQFSYSQIGYDLLAKIVERTSGKSFAELSADLFRQYGMKSSFHPDNKAYTHLVKGYTEAETGKLEPETETFQNYVAAGSFISTAEDLAIWNKAFFGGKLLKKNTMKMLVSPKAGAVRNHPIFGRTEYGYGITIDTKENLLQWGQTGYSPGFVSMNYYFPETQTSIIVLSNVVYSPDDLKKAFYYHTALLKIFRESIVKHKWGN